MQKLIEPVIIDAITDKINVRGLLSSQGADRDSHCQIKSTIDPDVSTDKWIIAEHGSVRPGLS